MTCPQTYEVALLVWASVCLALFWILVALWRAMGRTVTDLVKSNSERDRAVTGLLKYQAECERLRDILAGQETDS